jgi:CubicO group peptidase (beta-lactamase class C family)
MSTGGLSAARLGLMHRVMEGYVERGELPGLVTLVSRRGETHVDAVGTMAVGGTVPMGRDTVFRISSMTKPITAVATMILVEECRLRLDEPVDRLLPELADRRVLRRIDGPLEDTVAAVRPITVRDLLTFRMGFGMVMAGPDSTPLLRAMGGLRLGQGPPAPQEPPGPDEWMRNLGTLPLMHQPGERWMYNTGSDVLGVLVARASDRPFETFLRERVFGPLGMVDTGFATPVGEIGRLATAYGTDPSTGALDLYDEPATGQWSVAPAFPSGGAGLVSTVDDYLAFGRMLLDGGRQRGGRILSRPSVATMTTDHLTPVQKAVSGIVPGFFDSHGWGFGVSVVTRRDAVPGSIGTFGWDGGLGTSWFTDPAEELVVVLMTQCAWPSPSPPAVMRDFWTLTYAAIDD